MGDSDIAAHASQVARSNPLRDSQRLLIRSQPDRTSGSRAKWRTMRCALETLPKSLRWFAQGRVTPKIRSLNLSQAYVTGWSMSTFVRILINAAALGCLCMPQLALSAEFKKFLLGPSAPDLIEVVGELISGDEAKFIEAAIKSADAIVVFHSGGGNLLAGIEIGKAIRLKGFSTLVPNNMHCASACALAWLAGRVRLMSDTARIGFHAVYTSEDGETRVSSAGNAIAGAYLNQLGLPTSAIIYITDTPPHSMKWLNFADAQRVGIEVKRLN